MAEKKLIISNTESVPNKKTSEIIDIVRGNTIRARWFGRDILAGLKHIMGGEIKSYTKMLNDARDEALSRMVEQAKKLGADAIVNVRFTTSDVMQGAAEILVYGTAVQLK